MLTNDVVNFEQPGPSKCLTLCSLGTAAGCDINMVPLTSVEVLGKERTWVGGSRTGVFSSELTELGLAELLGP